MNSQEPGPEPELEPPAPEEELPPPPEDEYQEPTKLEGADWTEDYQEEIPPEKPAKPRRKKRHGGLIILAIVVVILLLWTVFSPDVMPVVGTEYLDPDGFANLGNVTGTRDLWSGNTEWGISVNGSTVVSANQGFDIMLLVTKVSEEPGNFFFKGTAIDLRNVSVYNESGEFLGAMAKSVDRGYGTSGNVTITLSVPGTYQLYVTYDILVYEVMLIGFIPLEVLRQSPDASSRFYLETITVT